MDRGVDYSYDPPTPDSLALGGFSFAVRYLSRNPIKNLTADEAKALSAVNVDVVLVWEDGTQAALLGFTQGVDDATEALTQASVIAPVPVPAVYFAVDFDTELRHLIRVGEYFNGVRSVLADTGTKVGGYGSWLTLAYLLDQQLIDYAWQTYGWSAGLWLRQSHLRQTLNDQALGTGTVDYDEAWTDQFGQWRWPVTYAPQDLLNVRAYLKSQTGLPDVSLGIVGDEAHSNSGYHIGATGVASFDYSRDEATPLSRDNPDPLTAAASAIDLGGDFPRFREITLALVAACEGGDPRTRDIREVIYTPDGVTVRRYDREGVRDTGDLSHLTHTHISFYRDSEGRRDADTNFLGLIKEIFEGATPEEDDMPRLFEKALEPGVNVCTPITTPSIQSSGVISYGRGFLSICNDVNAPGSPGVRTNYKLRIFWTSGGGAWARLPGTEADGTVTIQSGVQWVPELPAGCRSLSIQRKQVDVTDTCEYPLSVVIDVQ